MSLERTIVPMDGCVRVDFKGVLADEPAVFENLDGELVVEKAALVVFNFVGVTSWTQPSVRLLSQLALGLRKCGIRYGLISCPVGLSEYLAAQGLSELLPVYASLRALLAAAGNVTPLKLDVNFVNPFFNAVIQALGVQAMTPVSTGRPQLGGTTEPQGDISGTIGLVSDTFKGSIVITFPQSVFLGVANRMLSSQYTELNDDLKDVAGELLNIIFGIAKVELNAKGFAIRQAIPSVIMGPGHTVSGLSSGPRIVVPFSSEFGQFWLKICLTDQLARPSAALESA